MNVLVSYPDPQGGSGYETMKVLVSNTMHVQCFVWWRHSCWRQTRVAVSQRSLRRIPTGNWLLLWLIIQHEIE